MFSTIDSLCSLEAATKYLEEETTKFMVSLCKQELRRSL